MDPKENGYQNPHHLYLMQVRALTQCERVGALMVDAHGLDGHTFDVPQSRKFGGTTTMFWRIRAQFFGLINISKLLFYLHAFSYMIFFLHVHVLFVLCFIRYITCLNVVFVKTYVYTCTSSERHLIHIRLHFIVHLYSLYAHISTSFDDFPHLHLFCLFLCMLYFMYMQFLFKSNKYTCMSLESLAFMQTISQTLFIFGIYLHIVSCG